MSTDFVTVKKIRASALFDGRLEALGVRESVQEAPGELPPIDPDAPISQKIERALQLASTTSSKNRRLTDGENYLWVFINDEGFVTGLTRYSSNDPSKILEAIETAFAVDILSEHDEPQYSEVIKTIYRQDYVAIPWAEFQKCV
jgi:hypothetical protein